MTEGFQPPAHRPPQGTVARIAFALRLLCDFQVRTVHRDVQAFLADMRDKTVADVGCGMGPYRHLFDRHGVTYLGFDTPEADKFSYRNPEARLLEDGRIPMPDASVDGVLCTEVIEHLQDPFPLIAEMRRILRPGGTLLLTVPWSARFHYIPNDYHRFTPTALKDIFAGFRDVRIEPRGTEITVICAKTIVVALRHLSALRRGRVWMVIPLIVTLPLGFLAVVIGNISLIGIGSEDDPLGYTVRARK